MNFDLHNQPPTTTCTTLSVPDYWTPLRRELHDWFLNKAPSLATAYEGALKLMYMPGLPAKTHFVCHVIRDIFDKLPKVLDGQYEPVRSGEVYRNAVDKIARHISNQSETYNSKNAIPAATNNTTIPEAAMSALRELLEVHDKIKKQPRSGEVLERALRSRLPDSTNQQSYRLITLFKQEREWFVSKAHLSEVSTTTNEDDLLKHFNSFEMALHSLVGNFFTGTKLLDDILQQANQ